MRLAASDAARPPPLDPALRALAEALELAGPAKARAEAVLAQRLGDERTLALLAGGDPRAIGALLKAAGGAAPAESLRLGQILVAQGLVAPRRLEAALEAQKATQRRIGAELVAAGHIDAREVAHALWLQHKLAAAARELAARLAELEAVPPARLIAARGP